MSCCMLGLRHWSVKITCFSWLKGVICGLETGILTLLSSTLFILFVGLQAAPKRRLRPRRPAAVALRGRQTRLQMLTWGMLILEDADESAKDPVAQRASQLALAELGGIDLVHNDFDAFLLQLQDICPIMKVCGL